MRGGGYFRAFTAAAAIAGLSYGAAFGNALREPLGPVILGGNTPVHAQGPGGKRERVGTVRGRERGKATDPFFGIASKGRTGAKARAALMAEVYAKTGRRNRGLPTKASMPFNPRTKQGMARNAVFVRALTQGDSHNAALRRARRVTA